MKWAHDHEETNNSNVMVSGFWVHGCLSWPSPLDLIITALRHYYIPLCAKSTTSLVATSLTSMTLLAPGPRSKAAFPNYVDGSQASTHTSLSLHCRCLIALRPSTNKLSLSLCLPASPLGGFK